jgi:hypothetical protein
MLLRLSCSLSFLLSFASMLKVEAPSAASSTHQEHGGGCTKPFNTQAIIDRELHNQVQVHLRVVLFPPIIKLSNGCERILRGVGVMHKFQLLTYIGF